MTADLLALCEQLDGLRAVALSIRKDYPSLPRLAALHDDDVAQVVAEWSDGATAEFIDTFDPETADLIVAAVNALPVLTAAVRGLLADRDTIARVAALAEDRVLIAQCENYREDFNEPCTGTIRYRWGQTEAACDTCGGRCGIAVAKWDAVEAAS